MLRCCANSGSSATLAGEISTRRRLGRPREALYNCLELWRSRIFTLPASWACHSFVGAIDGQTPEPEAYDCMLLKGTVLARELAFFTPFLTGHRKEDRRYLQTQWVCYRRSLNLRHLNFIYVQASTLDLCPGETLSSLYWTVGMSAVCFTGKHYLYLLRL